VLRAVEPGVVVITDFTAGSTGSTRASGQGTGMVLDTQGDVLTNAHVVANATTVSVQVFGQTTVYQAKVLGIDTADDVALIQIQNPGKLTPIPLGPSAMPSGSPPAGRPSRRGSSRPSGGRSARTRSASPGCFRPMPPSTRATPAAPSPMPPAR
jgi:S1-C subfamily serine protease